VVTVKMFLGQLQRSYLKGWRFEPCTIQTEYCYFMYL